MKKKTRRKATRKKATRRVAVTQQNRSLGRLVIEISFEAPEADGEVLEIAAPGATVRKKKRRKKAAAKKKVNPRRSAALKAAWARRKAAEVAAGK